VKWHEVASVVEQAQPGTGDAVGQGAAELSGQPGVLRSPADQDWQVVSVVGMWVVVLYFVLGIGLNATSRSS
jgi:hypothetical protein